jgi:hypothetical protein
MTTTDRPVIQMRPRDVLEMPGNIPFETWTFTKTPEGCIRLIISGVDRHTESMWTNGRAAWRDLTDAFCGNRRTALHSFLTNMRPVS